VKQRLVFCFGFILFVSAFIFFYKKTELSIYDPDRYYHFALSREMVKSGELFLRSVPQVEDLGWGEFFVDKEFLFHQLTALGYRISGDSGAEWSAIFCTIMGMLAFLLFAGRHLSAPPALAVTFFVFSCPFFLSRLLALRPHLMGILGFFLMNIAVHSRRPFATALAVFFFTLSYHAFYIPIACLGLLGLLSFLEGGESGKVWRKVALFGAFGCLCGVLANPYFPGNIEIALIHARIPGLINGELAGLNFGAEHQPMRSNIFLEVFHAPILVILLATLLIGWEFHKTSEHDKRRRVHLLYAFGVACLFLVLSFKTRRAGEYLAPALGFLSIYLLQFLKRKPALLLAVPLLFGVMELGVFLVMFNTEKNQAVHQRFEETLRALEFIPKEKNGAKIYNCEWDFSPYIYYARPDLRFVDIMDPSLLYFANKGSFLARAHLSKGFLGDPRGMIPKAAKADYVFCNDPGITAQLRDDPGFRLIYPQEVSVPNDRQVPSLFLVKKEEISEYVRIFEVAGLGIYDLGQSPKVDNDPSEILQKAELVQSTHLDLTPLLAEKLRKEPSPQLFGSASKCAFVNPSIQEIERRAGATLLALGGGQRLEIWRNGKPLFRSLPAFGSNRSTQVVVPLVTPLLKKDKIKILVCSPMGAPFWGISLSFWTENELRKVCDWKMHKQKTISSNDWEHEGLQARTCIGPWAARTR